MTVIIAGERSGVGKTTITLSILAYLKHHNFDVQSFKVGPDYIDPMFHEYVTQKPCRNLDPILTSEDYVKSCFQRHISGSQLGVIEGVMGLFDGIPRGWKSTEFNSDFASTAYIAECLNLPIILVIDCSRLSGSVAAIAHGYCTINPRLKFAGIILNRVGSDRHLDLLKAALKPLDLPILGVLRRQDNITIPDRHLGLVPTQELSNLDILLNRLTELAANCFDWSQLLPLLAAETLTPETPEIPVKIPPVKIAIARDVAFSFYYADNLDLLQKLGAELIWWSPLTQTIPEPVDGLYFGGGFPEVFAESLSQNQPAIQQVRSLIKSGIPTYAECGGLMYLCDQIIDFNQQAWSMVGIIPTTAIMEKRLTLGYYQGKVLRQTPLLSPGDTVCGHQFHHSHLTEEPPNPIYHISRYHSLQQTHPEGWNPLPNVHCSYLHLHWGSQTTIPQRFLKSCRHNY
ncbi:MAG: cobyrinate a,c-diamide synthase [Arthrospira sp. SH-MAG29]|nr:cobyrinate a,c-diamide synthase [Arthrospira sp. SH-MAG29]MBS0015844.1 cobyrinate a,c-diamide synthase [Arthrospira sp. SH-MAG29]